MDTISQSNINIFHREVGKILLKSDQALLTYFIDNNNIDSDINRQFSDIILNNKGSASVGTFHRHFLQVMLDVAKEKFPESAPFVAELIHIEPSMVICNTSSAIARAKGKSAKAVALYGLSGLISGIVESACEYDMWGSDPCILSRFHEYQKNLDL